MLTLQKTQNNITDYHFVILNKNVFFFLFLFLILEWQWKIGDRGNFPFKLGSIGFVAFQMYVCHVNISVF